MDGDAPQRRELRRREDEGPARAAGDDLLGSPPELV